MTCKRVPESVKCLRFETLSLFTDTEISVAHRHSGVDLS